MEEGPLLPSVRAVCQSGPAALGLPHVAECIHDFVKCSGRWTLVRACRANWPSQFRRLVEAGVVDPFDGVLDPLRSHTYREWQFNEGLKHCVVHDNLELLQALARHFQGCVVWPSAAYQATRLGRFEILQWLDSQGLITRWSGCTVEGAIGAGHLEMAKWMIKKTQPDSGAMAQQWAVLAAGNGDLAALRWVYGLSRITNAQGALDAAVQNCHLDSVQWILEHANEDDIKSGLVTGVFCMSIDKPLTINLDGPVAAGRIDMVNWLLQHHRDACAVNGGDLEAARKGHFEIVRLLRTNKVDGFSERVLITAAEGGHLRLVQWLYEHGSPTVVDFANATDMAATNGFLHVVKWLHENTLERATTAAIDGAAANGHLEVVQWLHENGTQGCTKYAMDYAARSGHLKIVVWLHEHRTEGCTHRAMDEAARNGHRGVVEWLNTNRTEGCTTKAMDAAAANGHLGVVMWLHDHTREGCTTDAMDFAAKNNHLDVAKWLSEHRVESCTDDALTYAAQSGHTEMFRWLLAHRPESDTGDALEDAVSHGHYDIVQCLYQDGEEQAIVEAFQNSDRGCSCWEFMEWIKIRDPTPFEIRVISNLF